MSIRYPTMADRLNELDRERGELKLQGRIREMTPVQLAIVRETEKTGRVRDLANAWDYFSALHHQVREYDKAERAARKALDVYAGEPTPSAEALGCYQFKLRGGKGDILIIGPTNEECRLFSFVPFSPSFRSDR